MHIVSLGALLAGSLFSPLGAAPAGWQSLGIEQTVEPVFPPVLLQIGLTEGEARVAIDTDANGKLVEWLVVGYTKKEFADSSVAAIRQWNFTPARLGDESVGTIVELRFYFSAHGVVVSSANPSDLLEAQTMRMFAGRYTYLPCSGRELDQAPTPVVTVAPRYGTDLAKRGIGGSVRIDFYIDELGAVRMPCVAAENHGVLPALAIEALKQWRFAPPTSRGRAVLVKASEEFRFDNGG